MQGFKSLTQRTDKAIHLHNPQKLVQFSFTEIKQNWTCQGKL